MDEISAHPPDDALAWLRLHHCADLPNPLALKLVKQLGSAQAVLSASDQTLRATLKSRSISRKKLGVYNNQAVCRDMEWLKVSAHHRVIPWPDPCYPQLLRELNDAPLLLYVKGDPEVLATPQLAIVGSRNPTPTGRELAFRFAANLTRLGFTVTSGLALGIDAAAHRGALSIPGPTVAVMATGLDLTYPARHLHLAQQIAQCGALISEFPIGTAPRKHAFPQRNRLISGLSLGTLVVEAAEKSGSLITARLAGEQGREVYAVPGSVLSPQSKGCHALLRDGAKLVETEADILSELEHLNVTALKSDQSFARNEEGENLLRFMGYDPVTIDTLVDRSGLTADKVCSMLSCLELQGLVKAIVGGCFIRVGL